MKTRVIIPVAVAVIAVTGLLLAQGRGGRGGRPGEGRTPEIPPPSIIDYKPRSTLVVPEHNVPRAKFPTIDIHSHQPNPISPEQFAQVVKGMDANNLQILVNLSGGSGERLNQGLAAIASSPYKDRMVLRPTTNTSTTIATTTRSGSCTGWGCRTTC